MSVVPANQPLFSPMPSLSSGFTVVCTKPQTPKPSTALGGLKFLVGTLNVGCDPSLSEMHPGKGQEP